MTPQVVRFSSHPDPFQVIVDRCANPDCECADTTFHLTENPEGDATNAKPIKLEIRIDPQTWIEIPGPRRSPAQAAIVNEFLRDYPATAKEALADSARQKKEAQRRLREYRFAPAEMNTGLLVAYNQIASEHGSITSGGIASSFRVFYEGREYLVEDRYCTNPSCPCMEVHLQFMEYRRGAAKDGNDLAVDAFVARLSLAGKLTIGEAWTCPREQAAKVASAWQAKYGDTVKTLTWRYNKIKEIARRSTRPPAARISSVERRGNDRRVPRVLSPATHPGRNDPCPCGSGKKFKRCCGSDAARAANDFIAHAPRIK